MSSIAGLRGAPGLAAYSATKGGVRLLAKSVALEHAHDNIRCNSVHPGIIATPIWGKIPTGAEGNRRNAPIDPRERAADDGAADPRRRGAGHRQRRAVPVHRGRQLHDRPGAGDRRRHHGRRPAAAAASSSPVGAAAKGWIIVAALSGAISVAVGAFAAHGLDLSTEAGRKAREWLQTGSQYQIIHALAIMGVVVLVRSATVNAPVALAAQWLFLVGSVLFPGALYALAFGGPRWMGAVAPIGGAAFILGWLSLGLAALMRPGAD